MVGPEGSWGVFVVFGGVDMTVELVRGVSTLLLYIVYASISRKSTHAKVVI